VINPSRRNPPQAPRGRSGRHRQPVQKITIARDTAVHALWIALLMLVVAAIVVTIALSDELPRSPRREGKRTAVSWLLAQSGLTNSLLGSGAPDRWIAWRDTPDRSATSTHRQPGLDFQDGLVALLHDAQLRDHGPEPQQHRPGSPGPTRRHPGRNCHACPEAVV
jgi:hypothetical protein